MTRFASLSYEPAHYSKIIALCLFAYTVIYNKFNNDSFFETIKKNACFYSVGILQMLFMQSATAIVLCLFIILPWFTKKHFILFSLFLPIGIYTVWLIFQESIFWERVIQTWKAFLSFDIPTIISADGSAAVRIVPYFIYFKNIDFVDMSFWFGHGFDASFDFFRDEVNYYRDYIPEGIGIGGCFVTIPFNYGIIFFILFLAWIKKICFKKMKIIHFVLYFLVCYDMGFNTYIFCFASLIFLSLSYYVFDFQVLKQASEVSV